jgi:2'-5' RNA ligase
MAQEFVYIALVPPPEIHAALAMSEGHVPSRIHLTLAFLGSVANYSQSELNQLEQAVALFAYTQPSLSGSITVAGRFEPSTASRNRIVLWRGVEMDGLFAMRQALVSHLVALSFVPSPESAFVPHLTVAYLEAESSVIPDTRVLTWQPAQIVLCMGEREISFPFQGQQLDHSSVTLA